MKQIVAVDAGRFSRSVSVDWVCRIISFTLEIEKSKRRFVSVVLTDDRGIRRINKQFLKHDYATDVISFETPSGGFAGAEKNYLGDVVVSVQTARSAAKQLNISWREELARYLVHGLLHLLGYDDKASKDRKRMFGRQELILKKVLKKESLLDVTSHKAKI